MHRNLVRKPEHKRSYGRPRNREKDNDTVLEKQGGWLWTRLFWFRTDTSGRLLWTQTTGCRSDRSCL